MGYNCENKANKKTDAKRFPVFFYIIIFKPRIVTTVYAVKFSFGLGFNFFVHFVFEKFGRGNSPARWFYNASSGVKSMPTMFATFGRIHRWTSSSAPVFGSIFGVAFFETRFSLA